MSFDAKVPVKLKKTQQWFGSIISRPIDEDSRMNPLSPSGNHMEEEACHYIAPSPTLRPAQRIELYNQQYWWRLLTTLQDDYPLLTRLFGYYDFNQTIAIPYLQKYPPNHWSLNFAGQYLPKWIDECYTANDKSLVKNAAYIDWAFIQSFFAPGLPHISNDSLPVKGDIASLLDQKIKLQPHIHLFKMNQDLFSFRKEFLKEDPDYWVEHDFPTISKGKEFYFILYRNQKNNIAWKEISSAEYRLLSLFQSGSSIDEACQWLENQDREIL